MGNIQLGVNIDHVATLRRVRGGTTSYPDILEMANEAVLGGAQQITIHLREDRRHIQLEDLQVLSKSLKVPINLEMAVTEAMIRIAKKYKPSWCCLVPEKRQELTTEGGLNVIKQRRAIFHAVNRLQSLGIEISLFVDPDLDMIDMSAKLGAEAVELHTGTWVAAKGTNKEKQWKRLVRAATRAHDLGLRVHAGHGLDYQHTKVIRKLPHLVEVNIGHSLVCYALKIGLRKSVSEMKKCLKP
ncbi:MAG: pyridoxine 5'-phosphate synthase [Bdellovibrionota bacterium]